MTEARQHGFTLIELIIFIVVVSAGLAGILSVMNTSVAASADPVVRKQAMAVAESLLEEILLKDYCDPDTLDRSTSPPGCGAHTREASRNLYDDVGDYAAYATTSGIVDMLGDATPGLSQYNIASVTVDSSSDLTGVAAKRITVSVTGPGVALSLSAYRANY